MVVYCTVYLLLCFVSYFAFFFFSSRRRHTRCLSDWSSDVCSSDLSGLDVRRDVVPIKLRIFIDDVRRRLVTELPVQTNLARAASGHTAAPPRSDVNSRRFMCGWPPPGKRKCSVPHRSRLQSCVRPVHAVRMDCWP